MIIEVGWDEAVGIRWSRLGSGNEPYQTVITREGAKGKATHDAEMDKALRREEIKDQRIRDLEAEIDKIRCGQSCCATITQLKAELADKEDAWGGQIRELEHELGNARQAYALLKEGVKVAPEVTFEDMRGILQSALDKLVGKRIAPEWRPINSAPKDETIILVSDGQGVYEVQWARMCEEWYMLHGDKPIIGPTHWMPLPEPPKP